MGETEEVCRALALKKLVLPDWTSKRRKWVNCICIDFKDAVLVVESVLPGVASVTGFTRSRLQFKYQKTLDNLATSVHGG